ncbi:MAG: hypothetical protein JNL58_08175 [Planctomyces sp.]|nr:hypothetical protein [Planctomyces sp.]
MTQRSLFEKFGHVFPRLRSNLTEHSRQQLRFQIISWSVQLGIRDPELLALLVEMSLEIVAVRFRKKAERQGIVRALNNIAVESVESWPGERPGYFLNPKWFEGQSDVEQTVDPAAQAAQGHDGAGADRTHAKANDVCEGLPDA